jgi:hypothetical protein
MSASDWPGLLEEPAEAAQFFATPPDLARFDLFYLHIDERETGVTLGFALDELPDRPLPEWTEKGLNAFEFFLAFSGVEDLAIDGWSSLCKERISVERGDGGRVRVEIEGPGESVRFTAGAARWATAKAYLAARSE